MGPDYSSQPSAISALVHCFAQPLADARARQAAGDAVVGTVATTIPWEILRAAGFSPVVVRPVRQPAEGCEEFLEPHVFSPRIRALFESAVAGDLSFLTALAFARTSEQEYKAYLYLREVAREGRGGSLPPLWFFDLLYSPSPHAYEYGLAQTREWLVRIAALTGRAVHAENLRVAIAESNAARAAVRRLLALRRAEPKLSGAEALALLGSFFLLDRGSYAALANRAATEAERRSPLKGPRLILAGAWLDHERLHALLESHGAVVIGEDGEWGLRAAGRDIESDAEGVAAIFDKYYRDGPSVRQFAPADRAWLDELSAADVDGLVFYLPPDDSVMGWDMPHERTRLDARGIPSLVIRDDVDDPRMPARWHETIAAFIRQVSRRH